MTYSRTIRRKLVKCHERVTSADVNDVEHCEMCVLIWKQAMSSLNDSELARIGGVIALISLMALGAYIMLGG
jgi:hypothetical protein